jgi:hypothetical protein
VVARRRNGPIGLFRVAGGLTPLLGGPTEGVYHVAARAAVGKELFRDDHDFLRFERELERVLSSACSCVAACVLNTHYHSI